MQKYANSVQDVSGNALAKSFVTVYTNGTTTKATIYSDNGITPISNPLTAGDLGEFTFYAADGRYDLSISKSGITTQTLSDILLFDPAASTGSAGVSFKQFGTGALTRTVQTVLRDIVRSGDFATSGNYDTAKALLTGSIAFPPTLQVVGSAGNCATFGRGSFVANGTTNQILASGYNVAIDGQTIPDPTDTSVGVFHEANWNSGVVRQAEWHVDMAGPSQSYKRPFMAVYALTGANANKITDVNLASEVAMSLSASATGTMTMTALTFTVGTTGASFNLTGKIVVGDRILQAVSTDDTTSAIQIGPGDNGATTRTAMLFRIGGYNTPSAANSNSDGDKTVLYNAATLKLAMGIESGALWFQAGGSGTSGHKWYGTTGGNTLQMSLNASSALTVVGAFGCNGATARTAAASGGALNAYGAGANGLDSGANMSALHALVVAMRAALVANGIMS